MISERKILDLRGYYLSGMTDEQKVEQTEEQTESIPANPKVTNLGAKSQKLEKIREKEAKYRQQRS